MDPLRCQVYTQKGTQCSKAHKANLAYCGLHETKREETGPHRFANEQLTIKQKFEIRDQIVNFRDRRTQAGNDQNAIQAITDEQTIAEAHMTVRHRTELRALRDAQAAEIAANGGRNPDDMANLGREISQMGLSVIRARMWIIRRWPNLEIRNQFIAEIETVRTRARNMLTIAHITPVIVVRLEALVAQATVSLDEFIARAMQDLENGGVIRGWGGEDVLPPAQRRGAVVMALPNPNVLARIANDNQNVHTQLVVEQTKKNVAEILKIPVPEIYRWQTKKLSMTYKTIIMFCHLSPKSAWQFSSMYCSDATIYDLEPGIFGKVVDGVWQFISKSPDKQDLKKILTSELRDNIGMCAQGNLSRICNVLQGYLEGIEQKESTNVILGREFSKLMDIESVNERLSKGKLILFNNNIPQDQWETWLEPLRA
uniref:Uncharacterized protein n=1 Tax=viral metagenome TaxID=1070528 RepID=A0A6C0DQB8_9ZZZZ